MAEHPLLTKPQAAKLIVFAEQPAGDDLIYVARVRNGFVPAMRVKVFERLHKLGIKTCPFSNLPQRDKGRWGQGLTAEKMAECRWLKSQFVAQIEYADWTDVSHLRHSKFVALRDDKLAKDVSRSSRPTE